MGSETLGRMVREGTVEREGREEKRGKTEEELERQPITSLSCQQEMDSFQRVEPQRRSIKKSIARAFSRKKSHTATLLAEEDGDTSLHTTK